MQLDLFETESTRVPLNTSVKACRKCHEEKSLDLFNKKLSASGVDIKQPYCKACQASNGLIMTRIHKAAPAKPEVCDCCGKEGYTLVLDHDHTTDLFRGWLCYRCNSGIGALGDDLEGIGKAETYLRNHDERQ